jgi:phage gp45-like
MHRATPLNTSFRAYSAGGARTMIHSIDDGKLMQEMGGNFMKGETRDKVESPQNYGFTSVVRAATKDAQGAIKEAAEGFISFIGGNRSFPVCAMMDDRRYRLKELKSGDVAMFDHLQHQLHFNNDGIFITGRTDKKMKFQLSPPPQQQGGSGSSGSSGGQRDATGDQSGGSSGSSNSSSNKGQKQRYDQDSKKHLEITNDTTNLVHDQTINYKTGSHLFSSSGGATRSGGPLVQIFGDKFTAGLGHFMKQVIAAPPTSPMHLTTKGYVDSIFAALGINIPQLPSLPMPPLPPGVTLPPGFTLPSSGEASAVEPSVRVSLEARLSALERRVAELESTRGNRHS